MRTKALLLCLALGAACSKGGGSQPKDKAAPAAQDPGKAARPADVAVTGRRIDIQVKKDGYVPEAVDLKPNEQVTLVFTRVEETECGATVVVPSLNVKKPLPLNTPVAIELKADKEGEIGFACGMDMMHGKLIVKN